MASRFRGITRPANPVIPQDLSTKGYVDTNTRFFFFCPTINTSLTVPLFCFHMRLVTLESQISSTLFFDAVLRRLDCRIQTNSFDDTIFLSFRDDGVSLGEITVLTLLSGLFDSGVLTDEIANGSLIDFLVDLNLPTAGSIVMGVFKSELTSS